MSLYHWGNTYPWGENAVPEAGKFLARLTGNYKGLNGDDTAVPDLYAVYHQQHGKPESEAGGAVIDWRAPGTEAVAARFRADLPLDRLIFAP